MVRIDYLKKDYPITKKLPGKWDLTEYKYKFNVAFLKPFFEKIKQKKLIGLKCRICNTVSFPPKFICGKCLARPDQWVDLRETATVATFTNSIDSDPVTGETIYKPTVAVRQDGSDSTYLVDLAPDIKFEEVFIGMPVKIKWRENPEGDLNDIMYYERANDSAKGLPLLDTVLKEPVIVKKEEPPKP